MRRLLIFAGTTEGRRLSELLSGAEIAHTVCVATGYGEMVLNSHPMAEIHRGRMSREEMELFMEEGGFSMVVDATHPYARNVTENIKAAAEKAGISYLRLKRPLKQGCSQEDERYFDSHEACAAALEQTKGNILLTTGSKALGVYSSSEKLKKRLYVRVLPGIESLTLCMEHGIAGKQILALQGPFSSELNEALIRQYRIDCLVTKMGGAAGGYPEKLEAAKRTGIPVYVVGMEEEEDGDSFEEICRKLEKFYGRKLNRSSSLEIVLAGIGMGREGGMTREVSEAIRTADFLLGAERMIAPFTARREKQPFYRADQIIPYLKKIEGGKRMQAETVLSETEKAVVLFSGDSGFCSGCQSLYRALKKEMEEGGLNASVRILPGISSVSYLASCIGESYQDAAVLSMHGKKLPNLARRIRREEKTFLLMSGAEDVRALGRLLLEQGLTECEVVTGYQLSYPDEEIAVKTPEKCLTVEQEGLYTCLIRNPRPEAGSLTHGMADGVFLREKVPMTKEEVRDVSICKLKLTKEAVVYDIGSGTGSIAVEIAALSDSIRVFALERKSEAISLIKKNRERFGLENITVLEAEAPDGFSELPVPTHAFLGGSGGRMREILSALYQKNPSMRIVINAISMETICEIKEALAQFPVTGEEVVQLQASRMKKAGSYHLMQAENPVWICAFNFRQEDGV